MPLVLFIAGLLSVSAVSCSSPGSSGAADGDLGLLADVNAVPSAPAACPHDLPGADTACGTTYLACEYGNDPREACRDAARCQGGTWRVQARAACKPYVATALMACPYAREQMRNEAQTCQTFREICLLPDNKTCVCHNCGDDTYSMTPCSQPKLTWHCEPPFPKGDSACPALERPKIGDVCTSEGLSCVYPGICADLPPVVCQAGAWHENVPPVDCSQVYY